MLIDVLFDIFCVIWTVVGSLIGTACALILLVSIVAIIKGALR